MATLTRANVEQALITRCGPMLAIAGLDGTTVNGTNATLVSPIWQGVMALGVSTANPLAVTDADLAPITGWSIVKLLDTAELLCLRIIWGNWTYVKEIMGTETQELQQFADRVQVRINDLEAALRKPYGPNVGTPSGGHTCAGRRVPFDAPVVPPFGVGPDGGGANYGGRGIGYGDYGDRGGGGYGYY